MFILFLLILLIGLAGFAFVFMRALKSYAGPVSAEPGPLGGQPRPEQADLTPPFVYTPSEEVPQPDGFKIVKLEQLIDEKNRMIEGLQKNSQSGHDHDAQVDSLKQILQAQIEELKLQNKQLKAEVARLSGENIDLQTKVYAGQMPRVPFEEQIVIHPAASTSVPEVASGPVVEEDQEDPGNIRVNSLSLHDVFGGEEEKNS